VAKSTKLWKKGRGRLGIFRPLLGTWVAEEASPKGPVRCTRTFQSVLGGKYVQLTALWEFEDGEYEEHALYGVGSDKRLQSWSFTSDGKQSQGVLADVSDLHPEAIGFEAEMPAGLARMAYWPEGDGTIHWIVESKTKRGWNRFTHHRYRPLDRD
jgi:hypothetical protein